MCIGLGVQVLSNPCGWSEQQRESFPLSCGISPIWKDALNYPGREAAMFQQLTGEKMSGNLNYLEMLIYLEGLIVLAKKLEKHEWGLFLVWDRLEDASLKVSIEKGQFYQFWIM